MTTATEFVPSDLGASRWTEIEPFVAALRGRTVNSGEEFERWLLDRSELDAACSESAAELYINMTCNTDDETVQSAYSTYITGVAPHLKRAAFDLDRVQVELADRFGIDRERYGVLDRDTRVDVELFCDENVPIQTELSRLAQRYDQLCGAMMVGFDGQERTVPQMGVYQESQDRAVRESSWRAVAERRAADQESMHTIFDEMIGKRHQMAQNAGFDSFVGYSFRFRRRFDYSVDDCLAFHRACEEVIVPLARRVDQRRRERLGVDVLRPWDMSVDEQGRPALRPFTDGVDLMRKSQRVFDRLDPRLGGLFEELGDGSNANGCADGACLDLDSRRGKAPGGYQYNRDRSRVPFIFMNAAGLHRDVETMVHEAGHAFHSMLARHDPIMHYRESPVEFAEVASMSMELLTMPYWDEYYPDAGDLARARRQQLEGSVLLLPWIATIDAFQHWIYTNPMHSRDQRSAHWIELDERFGRGFSWDGLDELRAISWQRQPHLFGSPFYYIEYGIAQLGALGLWLHGLEHGESSAVDLYCESLALGGSKPLPELFAAAGLPFEFGPETVKRLADRVEAELEKLPE